MNIRHEATKIGLIFLDTDDFKAVNDRWGHSTGDEVLVELGRRIGACCVVSETAARLGGDEFAVIIENPPTGEAVRAFAERVLAAEKVRLAARSYRDDDDGEPTLGARRAPPHAPRPGIWRT